MRRLEGSRGGDSRPRKVSKRRLAELARKAKAKGPAPAHKPPAPRERPAVGVMSSSYLRSLKTNPRRSSASRPRKVKQELTGAGVALLDRRLGTAILHGARAVKHATKRRNPPLPVRTFTGKSGHLVSEHVLALEYKHAASAQRTPYRHDFDSSVELWALRDGSLLLRGGHGQRLWEDFYVSDGE